MDCCTSLGKEFCMSFELTWLILRLEELVHCARLGVVFLSVLYYLDWYPSDVDLVYRSE